MPGAFSVFLESVNHKPRPKLARKTTTSGSTERRAKATARTTVRKTAVRKTAA